MMQLGEVKVGDKLIVTSGGIYSRRQIETVTKVTKTQVATDQGRYSKAYGRLIGNNDDGATSRNC